MSIGGRGRPIYSGVMFDITEQKRAEERLRQLVEELPVVTYLANEQDPNGNHVLPYVAPKIEELTGIPASEWMARPETWAALDPSGRPGPRPGGEPPNGAHRRAFEIEYRFLRGDGSVVWVRDTAVMVERDGDWPVWQGVIEDVTARHEAEARQREAETRYRHLVERLPAVVYIDAVDEMATANLHQPAVSSSSPATPPKTVWPSRVSGCGCCTPIDREAVIAESDRTSITGEPFDLEYRIITKEGRTVWVARPRLPGGRTERAADLARCPERHHRA